MTREETKRIITAICTVWPNYQPPSMADAIDLWTALLADYTYQIVSAALQTYIMAGHAFAPTPGQLVATIPKKEGRTELEAWDMVRRSLRNGIYGAKAEYEKLPEDVRKAVGSPDQLRAWAMAPEDETETVMQSNFLRSYRAVQERKRTIDALPEKVRDILMEVNNRGLGKIEESS
ncbi:MAG: hypothetical protein J6S50_05680 [Oscillospiraceae bacterium]|nr:hypothetical protein [Lachnospiraceae bacterium]MBO7727985.1 hypothetical protein [Oscillospiraceae bacterium]